MKRRSFFTRLVALVALPILSRLALAKGPDYTGYCTLDGKTWHGPPSHVSSQAAGGGVVYFRDGNKWCAVFPEFENLQEDPAGFGDTRQEALRELWGDYFQNYHGCA